MGRELYELRQLLIRVIRVTRSLNKMAKITFQAAQKAHVNTYIYFWINDEKLHHTNQTI